MLEAQGGAPCGWKRQLGVIEMERWGGGERVGPWAHRGTAVEPRAAVRSL